MRMRAFIVPLFLLVMVCLCAPSYGRSEANIEASFVSYFKKFVADLREDQRQAERSPQYNKSERVYFQYRRSAPAEIRHDVSRTNSLNSPCRATITVDDKSPIYFRMGKTSEECFKAAWHPTCPTRSAFIFTYVDGKWHAHDVKVVRIQD
jgi:hypothetical protein